MENGNGERKLTPQRARQGRLAKTIAGFEYAHEVEMMRREKANGKVNGKKPKPHESYSVSKPKAQSETIIPELDSRVLEKKKEAEKAAFLRELKPTVGMNFARIIKGNAKLMADTEEAAVLRHAVYRDVERDAVLAKQKKLRGRFLQTIVKRAGELARRK